MLVSMYGAVYSWGIAIWLWRRGKLFMCREWAYKVVELREKVEHMILAQAQA